MNRPTYRDETVIREAAQASLDEFRQWLGKDSAHYADEKLIKDLCDAVRYEDDGYARAKYLNACRGYSPDSELVELLDGIDVWGAERRAVAKWVKEFDVNPPFPVGTIVQLEDCTGEIVKHDEEHGLATVCCPSKGHVKEGLGTHGFLIAWEKLKLPIIA